MARRPETVDNPTNSILIPEFLSEGQAIWNQPPYTFILADQKLLPVDAFDDENADIHFLRACVVFRRDQWDHFIRSTFKFDPKTGKISDSLHFASKITIRTLLKAAVTHLTPDYRYLDAVLYMRDQVVNSLNQYPFSTDYLRSRWLESGDYDRLGNLKRESWKNLKRISYAAYAYPIIQTQSNSRFLGLTEILPDASAAGDIMNSMPPKENINRMFRLLVSSEALN